MTYSEDYPSFAGDQTGQLLAEPDMVALSPVTSARVVETQSGYLVVIKKADERLSLSVKRRIGTPPSSHVLLTSYESLQLSRVLTDSVETLHEVRGDFLLKELSTPAPAETPETSEETLPARRERFVTMEAELSSAVTGDLPQTRNDDRLDRPALPETVRNDLGTIYGDSDKNNGALDWDEIKQPWRKRRAKQTLESLEQPIIDEKSPLSILFGNWKKILIAAAAAGALIGIIAAVVATSSALSSKGDAPPAVATSKTTDDNPMSADNVDKFVRNFVANMLDFNPKTYRSSQVHAMAVMTPDLLDRYWQETSFPLSKSKLKALRKDQTLMINKVVQQPTSADSTDVDMSADLATPGEETTTPIHLQIHLTVNEEGQLTVSEMKDSSHTEKQE